MSNTSSSAVIHECPGLVSLALKLNMDLIEPSKFSHLEQNCCDDTYSTGIYCDEEHIVSLNWAYMGLNGTMGASLPPYLVNLYMSYNQITGNFPELPDSLYSVELHSNLLSGSLPSKIPNNLNQMYVFWNNLSGDLPDFPLAMSNLWLGYSSPLDKKLQKRDFYYELNRFTGTLRLTAPNYFVINENYITDVIIEQFDVLYACDISANPIAESVHLADLYNCYQEGIYNASSLPNTLSAMSASTSASTSAELTVLDAQVSKYVTSGQVNWTTIKSKVTTKAEEKTEVSSVFQEINNIEQSSTIPVLGSINDTYHSYTTRLVQIEPENAFATQHGSFLALLLVLLMMLH